jgi:aminotransferase
LEAQTSIPLEGVINLGTGTPDFPTPAHVIEAAKRALDDGHTQYTAWSGILPLREAIAEKLELDNGLKIDLQNELIVTTGVQEALLVVFLALLDPGDEILVPSPYYNEYYRDSLVAGGRLVTVPTYEQDNFLVDVSEIEERISPRTKAIMLNTPGGCTGTVFPRGALEGIAELAQRYHLVVVSDEIYEKFLYDGHRHHSIAALPGMRERTVTVNGFSKHYSMTGWRVGYLTGPADLLEKMLALKHSMTICAPAVSQWAALAALTGPMDWWPAVMKNYEERRQMWMEGLDAIGLSYGQPQGAFYLMVNITPTGKSSKEFAQALKQEERVLVGPGTVFGGEGEGYVRTSFNTPVDKLEEGLQRLQQAVTRWRKPDRKV